MSLIADEATETRRDGVIASLQRRWVIEQITGLPGVVTYSDPREAEPALEVYVSNLNSPAAQFVFALSAMLAVGCPQDFLRLRVKSAGELKESAAPQPRSSRIGTAPALSSHGAV